MFAYLVMLLCCYALCPLFTRVGVLRSRPRYACVAQHRPLLPNEGEPRFRNKSKQSLSLKMCCVWFPHRVVVACHRYALYHTWYLTTVGSEVKCVLSALC